METAFHSPGVV